MNDDGGADTAGGVTRPAASASAAASCRLCDEPLPPEPETPTRCPSCGLWGGGRVELGAGSTLTRVSLAFGALYLLTVLLVALAR